MENIKTVDRAYTAAIDFIAYTGLLSSEDLQILRIKLKQIVDQSCNDNTDRQAAKVLLEQVLNLYESEN